VNTALAAMENSKIQKIEALAEKVLTARVNFDSVLHSSKRSFPITEFDALFNAGLTYANALGGQNWLHRDVAREISGIRAYLEIAGFNTNAEAVVNADRMESILFSGDDHYLAGFEQ